jgi:transcriptional regulator GlxA family with amidase domain
MRKVVMLCVPPAHGVDVVGPLEAFSLASRICPGGPEYALELVSNVEDRRIAMSSGVFLMAHGHYRQVRGKIDTLLIAGGSGARVCQDAELFEWLKKMAARVRRVCSICTGAALLAEAGLLRGKRATTHWQHVESFARKHPDVVWDPHPIWVQDGGIYTSAGVCAGMDLALALIEEDLGSALALEVARDMVLFLRRPGSQAQFSAALTAQATGRKSLQELQVWIAENLSRELSVETLAARTAMSARNFSRVFARELGVTPARYVEQVRLEAARARLESTEDSLEQVATRCGFSSAELLRRVFLRHLKVPPSEYRKHFHARMQGGVSAR